MRRWNVDRCAADPSDCVQYRWLTIATGAAPTRASSAVKPRPSDGWTPEDFEEVLRHRRDRRARRFSGADDRA